MKNIYLTLALLLTVSFAFATNGIEKIKTVDVGDISTIDKQNIVFDNTKIISLEYDITLKYDDDKCYYRVCWYPTSTTKRCTEWQEVPCDVTLRLESDRKQ